MRESVGATQGRQPRGQTPADLFGGSAGPALPIPTGGARVPHAPLARPRLVAGRWKSNANNGSSGDSADRISPDAVHGLRDVEQKRLGTTLSPQTMGV